METGQRVLVVDDETSIRRYLRATLTAQGFAVYEAANGQEAINAVLANHPDIIILDCVAQHRQEARGTTFFVGVLVRGPV